MTWREFFPRQFTNVVIPFLDRSLFEFIMKLPSHLRHRKGLYKETVTAMFPQLFEFKRATAGCAINWGQEFAHQGISLMPFISSFDSSLDSIIPPDIIEQLLSKYSNPDRVSFSPKKMAFKLASSILKSPRIEAKIFPHVPVNLRQIDHITFLKRVIVIRAFLQNVTKLNKALKQGQH